MKHNIYLLILAVAALTTSCITDNSVGAVNEVSDITINDSREVITIDLGEELVYEAQATQKLQKEELKYEWQLASYTGSIKGSLSTISTEKKLSYTPTSIGTYYLRLKVSNSQTATFKEYRLNVNAMFDRGLMICSNDEQGNGNLVFIKTPLSEEDIADGEVETPIEHCFELINPTITLKNLIGARKIVTEYSYNDEAPSNLQVVTADAVYFADPQTFQLYKQVNVSDDYPGEKIAKYFATDYYGAYPFVFTESKKVIHIDNINMFLYDNALSFYHNAYDDVFTGTFLQNVNNRYEINIPLFINYSPAKVGHVTFSGGVNTDLTFRRYNLITAMQMNGLDANSVIVITTSKTDGTPTVWLMSNQTMATEASYVVAKSDLIPPVGSAIVPCATQRKAFYNIGSKIYTWYCLETNPAFPTAESLDFGAGKEITCMSCSADDTELYVGLWDVSTKRGSLYIYDTSALKVNCNAKPTRKFENCADRITQICYKKRAS